MKQDRLLGLCIAAASLFLLWQTFSFPHTSWDALGMAFWPRLVLGGLLFSAALLIVRGRVSDEPLDSIDWRAGIILLAGVGYAVALPIVGFVLLTPPFMFMAIMLIGGRWTCRRLVEAVITALIVSGTVYVVFKEALLVQLPEGWLY